MTCSFLAAIFYHQLSRSIRIIGEYRPFLAGDCKLVKFKFVSSFPEASQALLEFVRPDDLAKVNRLCGLRFFRSCQSFTSHFLFSFLSFSLIPFDLIRLNLLVAVSVFVPRCAVVGTAISQKY